MRWTTDSTSARFEASVCRKLRRCETQEEDGYLVVFEHLLEAGKVVAVLLELLLELGVGRELLLVLDAGQVELVRIRDGRARWNVNETGREVSNGRIEPWRDFSGSRKEGRKSNSARKSKVKAWPVLARLEGGSSEETSWLRFSWAESD